MKRTKKVAMLLTAVILTAMLGGCGSSFDAGKYVQALLDNSYKNDSAAFVEQEVGTKEEAEKLYESGIDTEMKGLTSQAQISDELEAEFREVLKDVFKNVKYTIGETKKDGDNYTVEVKYQKMNVLAPAMETLNTKSQEYVDEMTAKAENGEETPSYEEMTEEVMAMMKDAIKESLKNVTYGDEETATVRIELKDKVYTANEEDVQNLEKCFLDIDEATAIQQNSN